jgi:LysR family glycine cleavage system transcriptional activator
MAKMPPLKALRVFEAAARHQSSTKAAEELCVTQGAVSQQIKLLEESLGVELFLRLNQQLRLTSQGRKYALEVREALRLISEATAEIQPRSVSAAVTISCLPSFAHKWLAPRLGRFLQAEPGISLRLHTSFEVVDLFRHGVDCAIRHGSGGYDGCFAEILMTEELAPMCTPQIAAQLTSPEDLAEQVLLRDYGTEWRDWLEPAGIDDEDLCWGAEFQDSSVAIQAAIDGRGVILGHTMLAHDDLRSGALVAPFEMRVPYDCAHWFVCRRGEETRPEIAAVRAWLRKEAAAFPSPSIRLGRLQAPPAAPFG